MRCFQMESRPTVYDDASRDHEQFERQQLAKDQDRRQRGGFDMSDRRASNIVDTLIDEGTVRVIPEEASYHHEPSGTSFSDQTTLATFHQGWEERGRQDE
jgi:hypothetical protein